MNWDLVSLVLFYLFLLAIYFRYKSKFEIQSKVFVMFKSKLGIDLMDKISAKFPRLLHYVSYISVFTGFAGMAFIFYFIVKETVKFISIPGANPPLSPVLPGIEIPGAPALSFWHWIIALFFVALVHEFCHGIYARLYGIKVKSSGFAFLGPILAAFVEPDERQMASKPKFQQLAVLSAGPFSNFILGGIFFMILLFIMSPVVSYTFQSQGIIVNSFVENYPMSQAGVKVPFVIEGVNDVVVSGINDFANASSNFKPGDIIELNTDQGDYSVTLAANPDSPEKGFLGITGFQQKQEIRDNLKFLGKIPLALIWINLLFVWIFIINIGVGLFNLLPLGPVDGGKMFLIGATALFKDEAKAKKIFVAVTYFLLILIFVNLLPWIMKLFSFLLKSFLFLVSLV